LRIKNELYNANMVFVKVDWDVYSGSKIARKYNIPRRSTLLVLRGDQKLGRIVAATSKNKITALMNLGIPGVIPPKISGVHV
jgi:thioredoxin